MADVLKFERKRIASTSETTRQQRIDFLKNSINVFKQAGRNDLAQVALIELRDQIEIQALRRSL